MPYKPRAIVFSAGLKAGGYNTKNLNIQQHVKVVNALLAPMTIGFKITDCIGLGKRGKLEGLGYRGGLGSMALHHHLSLSPPTPLQGAMSGPGGCCTGSAEFIDLTLGFRRARREQFLKVATL